MTMTEKSFMGLIHLLALLKKRGYTEVWLNAPNEHWGRNMQGMIVAAPKRRHGSWPAVWDLDNDPLIHGLLGRQGCGNGLKNADQAQYDDINKNIPPSHYVLVGGHWEEA